MQNRRQFTRVLCSMKAKLTLGNSQFDTKIHDISLNGALIHLNSEDIPVEHQYGVLSFLLDHTDIEIEMNVAVVHQARIEVGLQCIAIDIDSVSLLRRLIELNLGDDEQLHKELSQLSHD